MWSQCALPHLIHASLRIQVHILYGISISSAVFAGLKIVTDRPRDSVCNNKPYLRSTAIWPKSEQRNEKRNMRHRNIDHRQCASGKPINHVLETTHRKHQQTCKPVTVSLERPYLVKSCLGLTAKLWSQQDASFLNWTLLFSWSLLYCILLTWSSLCHKTNAVICKRSSCVYGIDSPPHYGGSCV